MLFRILHELMHAVGFWHEQSRPDRDEHVTIKWENINHEDRHKNFKKKELSRVNMVGRYDMCSIMHYGLWDFGKYNRSGRLMTIKPKHDRFEEECNIKEIGERQNFTREDIEKLNVLYDCNRRIGTIYLNIHTERAI